MDSHALLQLMAVCRGSQVQNHPRPACIRKPLVYSVKLARRALLDADDFTLVSIPVWGWSTNTD